MDVAIVASRINVELNNEQINEILGLYESEQEQDPTATWDLVIEHIIYSYHFDQ
jgi:hypothetical protein